MSKIIYFRYHIEKKITSLTGVTINIGNTNDCDFIITGNPSDIESIALKTIFVNMDKLYRLIFNDCQVEPNTNFKEKLGIMNVDKKKIEKYPLYDNKIASFCLYNNVAMYSQGAIENAIQYKKKYPDVVVYMYTRRDVKSETVSILKKHDVKVVYTIYIPDWLMMFARFYPVENPKNIYFLSRDTDCRPSDREDTAIKQWLNSNKSLHIIRDHVFHNTKILGGLWGLQTNFIPNIRFMIMEWCIKYIKKMNLPGPDQHFLNSVYALFPIDKYANDEFHKYENEKYKINSRRINREYVGEAFDEMNNVANMNLRR
jgi:hypothetical protein